MKIYKKITTIVVILSLVLIIQNCTTDTDLQNQSIEKEQKDFNSQRKGNSETNGDAFVSLNILPNVSSKTKIQIRDYFNSRSESNIINIYSNQVSLSSNNHTGNNIETWKILNTDTPLLIGLQQEFPDAIGSLYMADNVEVTYYSNVTESEKEVIRNHIDALYGLDYHVPVAPNVELFFLQVCCVSDGVCEELSLEFSDQVANCY